jgi:arylsulfatase A-like enzyme
VTGAAVLAALVPFRSPAPAPASLILVTVDTLRADRCSAYGHARATTPHLDRLAGRGVLFKHAYTPMPTTLPAHVSLFTGLLPTGHGVRRNGRRLPPLRSYLPETLQGAGYQTAAVVASFVLDRSFGLDRGFDLYDDEIPEAGSSYRGVESWEGVAVAGGFDRRAAATTDRALAVLKALDPRRPAFLWVHYFDPHHPYDPPEAYAERSALPRDATERARRLYDGEVAYADAEIGRLFAGVEAHFDPRRTLVVLTADHGEGLMTHGFMGHGAILYEEAIRIPLVMRWDGTLARRLVEAPVSLVDLAPTLLGLLGLPLPPGRIDGRDLSSALRGGRPIEAAPVFFERRLYDTERVEPLAIEGQPMGEALFVRGLKRGVRSGQEKYLEAPDEGGAECYDLERDPGETVDRCRGGRGPGLSRVLARGFGAPGTLADAVSAEVEERLKAMGYVR